MNAVVVINTITAVIAVCEHLRAEAFQDFSLLYDSAVVINLHCVCSYRSVENAFMFYLVQTERDICCQ